MSLLCQSMNEVSLVAIPAYAGVVALSGGLVAILFVGIQRQDIATVVNAVVSIGAVLLPLALEFGVVSFSGQTLDIGPAIPLWLATAGFLHSLGMLGLYETVWWWDHLTHTLSAAFIAALIYATLIVVVPRSSVLNFSPVATGIATVLYTFWIGVLWELIELVARDVAELFDVEPVLVHYGRRDTALDLGFDVLGALLIVFADVRVFVSITEQLPAVTEAFLFGSAGVTVVGSLLMILGMGFRRMNSREDYF